MEGYSTPKWHAAVAGRQPAPGGLELVREFINSADIEGGTDAFATPAVVGQWFREREIPVARRGISEADRKRLVEVREALRDLLAHREAGEPADAARALLDRAAQESPLRADFASAEGARLEPAAPGVSGLIGRLLAEVAIASVSGTWDRLKVCANDGCRWAFYDASRNHSGIWCSMAVCGNRSKGRAFRGRRRRGERG